MKTLHAQQQVFQALSDPTRLRMVRLLLGAGQPICQCEFVDSLEVSPANISRHAKILLQAGLLEERREGKWVYYQVAKGAVSLRTALAQNRDPVVADDLHRFQKRLKLRQAGKCLMGVQSQQFR